KSVIPKPCLMNGLALVAQMNNFESDNRFPNNTRMYTFEVQRAIPLIKSDPYCWLYGVCFDALRSGYFKLVAVMSEEMGNSFKNICLQSER
ncbi:hypothetical protein CSKR_102161, partial [Clonorchis sinensis]